MTAAIRVGVLGSAEIARRRMLPAFARSAAFEVAAIASRDPERGAAAAAPYRARVVPGYAHLIDDADVDAVYVPLPLALHAEWVEAALRAGKHVLAEKPLSTSPEVSARLFALARRRGLALMENVMFVHHGQHARVRRLVEDGAIGEPRSFQASFTVPRRASGDIRYCPELGGGALWDTGVYPVRAAQHLLGAGLTVVGAVATAAAGFDVDTAGAALLRRDGDGVTVQLSYGLDHAYRSTYEISGSTGRLTLDTAFTPPADHVPVIRLHDRSGGRELRLDAEDQVAATVAAFAEAVRRGGVRAEDERATLEQGRLLREILRAAVPAPALRD
ncbi:Gfo/Idh/MocA family protein [Streptomyces fumanus]|uniref:Oxidoreductase n=1 Tax=Streptomyces fumanus TaxID=67302 RepID=A0A919AH24_9ACTN|nr:Gfo/Idh/MocA family oxidoreductase [Streptomyces fumanus]GHF08550.1 oxidoreductase [Streptomyces fumanus]